MLNSMQIQNLFSQYSLQEYKKNKHSYFVEFSFRLLSNVMLYANLCLDTIFAQDFIKILNVHFFVLFNKITSFENCGMVFCT